MKVLIIFLAFGMAVDSEQVKPVVSQRTITGRANIVRLAPRYATAIKMPEPVSSVVLGDPAKFLAEHSDKEPTLVLVKPLVYRFTKPYSHPPWSMPRISATGEPLGRR